MGVITHPCPNPDAGLGNGAPGGYTSGVFTNHQLISNIKEEFIFHKMNLKIMCFRLTHWGQNGRHRTDKNFQFICFD